MKPHVQILNRHGLRALAMLVLLASCATPDAPRRMEGATGAKVLLAESRRARNPTTQLGLALAAADKASENLGDARLTYNAACVEIAALVGKVPLPATFSTPVGDYRLEFSPAGQSGVWAPSTFVKLVPTSEMRNRTFVSRNPLAGYGGALVGVVLPPNPRAMLMPRVGVSAPVTAVVQFSKPKDRRVAAASLTLYDPSKQSTTRIGGVKRELASDLKAPFGYYPNPANLGLIGALMPAKFFDKEGLFLTQPYDPKKIPIVFVHGLTAVPQMWLPVMAAIESDPVLRSKYQFWVFAYPTGNPIAYSALRLREGLQAAYEIYPESKRMVNINHSLGGDITHMQVINPGNALVEGVFRQNAPKIMALPSDSLLKRALIFDANPKIARVVFIATPHRGAPLAINPIAAFIASLIRLPATILTGVGSEALQLAGATYGVKGRLHPTVQAGLTPNSPMLTAMNSVPMVPPFHSIIGVYGKPQAPLEKTSDTIVPYWSSHQAAARSEKIVPAPHTTIFVHPEAIAEMKRILHLHLKQQPNGKQ